MGCPCSKLRDDQHHQKHQMEAVVRCKQRKELLKHATEARSAFAAAHADYLQALSNTGVAFQEFFKGELWTCLSSPHEIAHKLLRPMALEYTPTAPQRAVLSPPRSSVIRSAPSEYHDGVLLMPPPPPPGYSGWDFDFFQMFHVPPDHGDMQRKDYGGKEETATQPQEENLDEDEEDDDLVLEIEGHEVKVVANNEKFMGKAEDAGDQKEGRGQQEELSVESHGHASMNTSIHDSCDEEEEKNAEAMDDNNLQIVAVSSTSSPRDLVEIFRLFTEKFFKASESGVPVARMLEAGSGHSHPKFKNTTELGRLGQSSRLKAMALTWQNEDVDILGEESDIGWSHALTLEKLYAWEMRLYEEVKAHDAVNAEFKKKRELLSKYDVNKGTYDRTADKTRADIKAIETQLSVAIQAVEATSAAIKEITNQELHFQLVELLQGLADMWKEMHECHEHQKTAALDLKLPQENAALEGNSITTRNATHQLEMALTALQYSLNSLISTEKEYVRSISAWLKASTAAATQNQPLTRRKARSVHMAIPEIYYLCQEWEKSLDQHAGEAIKSFAGVLSRIRWHQAEQMKVQKRVEDLAKELNRKVASLNSMERKHVDGKKDLSSSVSERRTSIEWFKRQMDEEKARLREFTRSTTLFTMSSIQSGLPGLFQGISEFARTCMEKHQELHKRAKQGIKLNTIKGL